MREGDIYEDEDGRTRFINKDVERHRTQEMDEALIGNWNERVHPQDTVYHLGDVIFSRKEEKIKEILNRLNGRICLIRGNHDSEVLKLYPERFEWVRMIHMVEELKKRIVCCHYKMTVWQDSHKNSIQLFGHSHGGLSNNNKQMDVGVDANNNFSPLSLEDILKRLDTYEEYNIIQNKS